MRSDRFPEPLVDIISNIAGIGPTSLRLRQIFGLVVALHLGIGGQVVVQYSVITQASTQSLQLQLNRPIPSHRRKVGSVVLPSRTLQSLVDIRCGQRTDVCIPSQHPYLQSRTSMNLWTETEHLG